MSDTVEPFTLGSFDEENDYVEVRTSAQFTDLFDTPPESTEYEEEFSEEEGEIPARPDHEALDVEAETRKIFEDAFAQGEKAGYEMGLKRVEPLVKRLNNYIADMERLQEDLMQRTERASVELALLFAETIILKSCEEHKEIITEMTRKALDICEGKSDVIIRVRPDDAQYVASDGRGFLKVVPDDSIREPGFVIETSFGDIDGKISTQIEELRKRISE